MASLREMTALLPMPEPAPNIRSLLLVSKTLPTTSWIRPSWRK